MDTKPLLAYCYQSSERKWQTATSLLKTKHYADCLFFCHLSLEFLLKAKVVEATHAMFPMTHDLSDLARRTKLNLTQEQKRQLAVINTFNLGARYDDYKLSFYKKATAVFAKTHYAVTQALLVWLKK